MINKDLKVERKEGKTFPPLPKDVYQVELLDITSRETVTYDTKNKPEDKQEKETVLSFQFTLLEGKDGETDLRGRNVWANYVPTYLYVGKNGKNKLYRIVEAFLARELTPTEEAGGITGETLNKLIGHQCRISVEPKISGDKTFDNITDWLKANTKLSPLNAKEKEVARVKSQEEKKEEKTEVAEEEEVSIDGIPF